MQKLIDCILTVFGLKKSERAINAGVFAENRRQVLESVAIAGEKISLRVLARRLGVDRPRSRNGKEQVRNIIRNYGFSWFVQKNPAFVVIRA